MEGIKKGLGKYDKLCTNLHAVCKPRGFVKNIISLQSKLSAPKFALKKFAYKCKAVDCKSISLLIVHICYTYDLL